MLRRSRLLISPLARGLLYSFRCYSHLSGLPKLILTPSCVQRLKSIEDGNTILRILVDSGGCSGFQYKFQLTGNVEKDDELIEQDGIKVVIDEVSLDLLRGATVDFEDELIRSGFRISRNPQAEKGCSCGVSFALKMD